MSTRTIIEINHDHLSDIHPHEITGLIEALRGTVITKMINENEGKPVTWTPAVKVLAQRHHSEEITLVIK